jgi:hypothetical protein
MASWTPAGAFMAFDELSSLDWPTLEKIAGVRFTESHRTRLLKAVNAYLYGWACRRQEAHIKDVRRRLEQIKTHASKLSKLLADSSPMGQSVLHLVYPWDVAEPLVFKSLVEELIFNIRKVEQEKTLSGKAGKPPDVDLPPLLRTWYAVYREAGGTIKGCYWSPTKNQYRGRFLDLLECVLSELNARLSRSSITKVNAPALIQFTRNGLAEAILPIIRPKSQQSQ